jgi:hypothetical protein
MIAIDIGKYMGFYNGSEARTLFLGDPPKQYGAPFRPVRFARFADHYAAYLRANNPEVVVYERPFSRGLDATRSGWGYAGIIEGLSTGSGAAVLDPTNGSVRKWATGSGKKQGSKEPMIARAKELTGLDLDEHSADAVCIYHYVLETMEVG